VVIPAFVIAPVLTVLHKAYGIGSTELPAPQATLFASIARAMFTEAEMPWNMVMIGAVIGIALVALDEYLRSRESGFRAHVMPVAVGIYLPLGLAVPILIGGLVQRIVKSTTRGRGDQEAAVHRGVLFSSGLIAGEAIMGIVVALLIVGGLTLPVPLLEVLHLPTGLFQNFISVFLFIVVIITLILVSLRRESSGR
jgi:putative OPT family oligopeptide transporter